VSIFTDKINVLASCTVELPVKSTELLAKKYGEIFSIKILGTYHDDLSRFSPSNSLFVGEKNVFICSAKLAQEVLNEKRFHKHIESTLEELRGLVGDALFTARHGESNWGVARK
jgi:cytochrome P450/NADPH-cytochrome P450 reductase